MKHLKVKDLKIDKKNIISAVLIGLLTLVGLFVLDNLGLDRRKLTKTVKPTRQKRAVKKSRSAKRVKETRTVKEVKQVKTSEVNTLDYERSLNELPTIKDIRSQDREEVVHGHSMVAEAGRKIGQIEEALQKNPKLLAKTLKFYKNCISEEQIYNPVRALCLHYLSQKDKTALETADKRLLEIVNMIHTI
jgi:hypothetical protein